MIIVLFAVLFILFGALGYFLIDKFDSEALASVSIIASVMSFFTTVIMLIVLLFLPISVEKMLANYEGMKITISDARLSSDMTNFERVAIMDKIIESNQTIQRHRNLDKNFWVGCYYSERIAELDYILIPKGE